MAKRDNKTPKKEKRTKKERDPNKPKKPQTAFFMYLSDHREAIKKEFPELKVTEISKKASERWKELPEDEKKVYNDKVAEAKKQYEKDMEAYNAKKNNSSE